MPPRDHWRTPPNTAARKQPKNGMSQPVAPPVSQLPRSRGREPGRGVYPQRTQPDSVRKPSERLSVTVAAAVHTVKAWPQSQHASPHPGYAHARSLLLMPRPRYRNPCADLYALFHAYLADGTRDALRNPHRRMQTMSHNTSALDTRLLTFAHRCRVGRV